jgi:hypothetical protein
MFCDRCGATVPPEQRYCGRCGKELFAPVSPAYPAASRVQQHVRLLGILWLAFSALNAVGGFAVLIVANTIFGRMHPLGNPYDGGPPAFLHPLLSAVGCLILIKAAAGFLTGWGLLHRERWARLLTIVLSFFALFSVPFGTALGIYGLWILLPAESEAAYDAEARRANAA